jgi:hypothetical protein
MTWDRELAERLRAALAREPAVSEKSMFGGLAFLVNGRLTVAASRSGGILLRVDPDDTDVLVTRPHVERFVMRGREMQGWLHVTDEALTGDAELAEWVGRALAYVATLPATA